MARTMNTNKKCDVCGRPTKHHDTAVVRADREVVVERHLCGIHGKTESLNAYKDALAAQVADIPAGWRLLAESDSQLRKRISQASSLREIAEMFRLDQVAECLRQNPPAI
jgi:hypothetical protein